MTRLPFFNTQEGYQGSEYTCIDSTQLLRHLQDDRRHHQDTDTLHAEKVCNGPARVRTLPLRLVLRRGIQKVADLALHFLVGPESPQSLDHTPRLIRLLVLREQPPGGLQKERGHKELKGCEGRGNNEEEAPEGFCGQGEGQQRADQDANDHGKLCACTKCPTQGRRSNFTCKILCQVGNHYFSLTRACLTLTEIHRNHDRGKAGGKTSDQSGGDEAVYVRRQCHHQSAHQEDPAVHQHGSPVVVRNLVMFRHVNRRGMEQASIPCTPQKYTLPNTPTFCPVCWLNTLQK